ncbi:MAG: PaaI family thioesterase [Arenibacterium sp.]
MPVKMSATEVSAFLEEVFPQMRGEYHIDFLGDKAATMRLRTAEHHLRPGGTVSGPSMFSLADICVYVMVLGMIGPKALAVTTNCAIDFMRKPVAGVDLIGEGKLLKLGKLLAVGEVHLRSEGSSDLVARASVTYAIPPDR